MLVSNNRLLYVEEIWYKYIRFRDTGVLRERQEGADAPSPSNGKKPCRKRDFSSVQKGMDPKFLLAQLILAPEI